MADTPERRKAGRRKADEDLRISEERYRLMVENANDIIWKFDLPSMTYSFVSPAVTRILGYSVDETMGMQIKDVYPPSALQSVVKAFEKLIKGEIPGDRLVMEVEHYHKNGKIIRTEVSSSPIRDDRGMIAGLAGVTRDITDRKLAEEELRKSEEKYRTILNNMLEVYFEVDLAGNLTFANKTMCENLGYSEKEIIGLSFSEYTDEQTAKELYQVYNNVFKTGEPVTTAVFEFIRKDGTILSAETSASLIVDGAGKPIGFRGVSRDVTERKLAEEALKIAHEELLKKNKEIEGSRKNIQITLERLGAAYEELKSTQAKIIQHEKMASIGQLAAGVAHEINNPMSFVASNLKTLGKYLRRLIDFIREQDEEIKSFGRQENIENIEKKRKELRLDYITEDSHKLMNESLDGTERVKKIVQSLNRLSRVDDSEYRETDINECMEQSVNIVWNEIKYKATLHKDYGKLSVTKCYPGQLSQVFINLLVNASQAIEKKGKIRIKTWQKDKEIWIALSDTGSGIKLENMDQIFEPFYTTKRVGEGTGLGLSISYDVVQRHKGDITVESKEGKGTTFTIRMPVVE